MTAHTHDATRGLGIARLSVYGEAVSIRSAKKNAQKKKVRSEEAAQKERKLRPLTKEQVRFLRSRGHHIEPVLAVGKDGVTEGVIAACREQLLAHELIKARVQPEAPEDRHETFATLAKGAEAALIQVLGRTALLYKPHPKKAVVILPAAKFIPRAPVAEPQISYVGDDAGIDDA